MKIPENLELAKEMNLREIIGGESGFSVYFGIGEVIEDDLSLQFHGEGNELSDGNCAVGRREK